MIEVSIEDAFFMLRELELTPSLRARLEQGRAIGLLLTDDEADELRDLCGERLQVHGFDTEYLPTSDGRKLELLVDRLFIG